MAPGQRTGLNNQTSGVVGRRHRALAGFSMRITIGAAVLAPLVVASIVGVASFTSPGYSPLSQTMSRLAAPGMPRADLFRLALIVQAIGMTSLAFLIWRVPGANRFWLILSVLLIVVYGLVSLIDAIVAVDSPRTILWRLTADQVHQDSAHLGIISVFAAMVVLTWTLWRRTGWEWVSRISVVIVAVVAVVGAPFPFNIWPHVHGALERTMLGLVLVWAEIMAVRLAQEANQQGAGKS